MKILAASTEYIHVPITADADLTALPVEMAVIPHGTVLNPAGDFRTAAWSHGDAILLAGPVASGGIVTLTAGATYKAYVRVTSDPEIPIVQADGLIYAR